MLSCFVVNALNIRESDILIATIASGSQAEFQGLALILSVYDVLRDYILWGYTLLCLLSDGLRLLI